MFSAHKYEYIHILAGVLGLPVLLLLSTWVDSPQLKVFGAYVRCASPYAHGLVALGCTAKKLRSYIRAHVRTRRFLFAALTSSPSFVWVCSGTTCATLPPKCVPCPHRLGTLPFRPFVARAAPPVRACQCGLELIRLFRFRFRKLHPALP